MKNIDDILKKQQLNIKDLAYIINRETQTIRVWEKKGIISEADMRAENNWRLYSRKRAVEVLEQIINHSWKRQVIKNVAEVKNIVDQLKNNH